MSKARGRGGGKGKGGGGRGGGGGGGGAPWNRKRTGKAALDFNEQKSLRQVNENRNDMEDERPRDFAVADNQPEEEEEAFLSESLHSSVFQIFNQFLREQELTKLIHPSQTEEQLAKFKVVRPMNCLLGILSNPHGSVKLWQGDTCVVVAFYGPSDCRMSKELPHRGVVDVLYRPKITGASQQQALAHDVSILEERSTETILTNIFETIIYLDEEPAGTGFNVIVHEYENDGCILSACINATMLAILDAGASIRNTVASVSAVVTSTNELIIDPKSDQLQKEYSSMLTFVFSNDKKLLFCKSHGRNVNAKVFRFILDECQRSSDEIFKYFKNVKRSVSEAASKFATANSKEVGMEIVSSDDEILQDVQDKEQEEEIEEVTLSSDEEEELEDGEIED